MMSDEFTASMIRALEAEAIPYMVVGSISSNVYGISRLTKDADIVIELGSHSIRNLANRLGPQFQLDPQLTFESVTATTRYIIKVADTDFKIELFQLSEEAHDQERFRRRRSLTVPGVGMAYVASPEDVVITKLNWHHRNGRGKDREDVRDVLAVQGDALDFDYIHSWCERHGTRQLLDDIRASIPRLD